MDSGRGEQAAAEAGNVCGGRGGEAKEARFRGWDEAEQIGGAGFREGG